MHLLFNCHFTAPHRSQPPTFPSLTTFVGYRGPGNKAGARHPHDAASPAPENKSQLQIITISAPTWATGEVRRPTPHCQLVYLPVTLLWRR